MANWNNPTVTSNYSTFVTEVKDRDLDCAKGLDPAVVTVTNPVANMVRWNSANNYWEKYNGSSWAELSTAYAIQVGAFTGDVTKPSGSSALTIAADAVTDTKLRNSAALSVIGRAANSSGDPADIAAGVDDRVLARTASALSFVQLTAGMFPANVVSNAKLAQMATDTLKGRDTAGTGDPEDLSVAAVSTMLGLPPAGTRMLFQQTSAPTGWTKDTTSTYNDAALRLVTGTVTTGGADAFSTHFGTSKSTAGFTLTTAEMPAHTHREQYFDGVNLVAGVYANGGGSGIFGGPGANTATGLTTPSVNLNTQSTGGGGSHSHTLNNFNIKFADCIIATKD